MVAWACLGLAIVIVVCANVMPYHMTVAHHADMFRAVICLLLAGWLADIWHKRQHIKRRLVLLVMLGYYIWMTATDNVIEMTTRQVAVETGGVLCLIAWLLHRRGRTCNEKP